ncbi:MAG: uridine kinase family protein, partial [Planctomycetota bacterium]
RERSLPRRASVTVRVGDASLAVATGTEIGSLLPTEHQGSLVVAGLLDKRPVSLITPVSSECSIEPLTAAHWEGKQVVRRSLALVLLEAAHHLDPGLRLQLDHSVGFGQRVIVEEANGRSLEQLAEDLDLAMHQLAEEPRLLRSELWTVDEARTYFERSGWESAAELLATWREPAVPLNTYGEVYAVVSSPLLPRTDIFDGFQVRANGSALLLAYTPEVASRATPARLPHEQPHGSRHERWLRTLGIESVGAFNRVCVRGDVSELIRVSEGFQEKRIGEVADAIAKAQRRVICIAGPSSSGKTTFIKRLRVQLQVNGLDPHIVSLDNYYVNRSLTPRDANGEFDFEAFDALRLDALREDVQRLTAGEAVKTPHFDFATGCSQPEAGPELRLGDRSLLLLEGIHGLNPELLPLLRDTDIFRVFVCPLAQLPFDRLSRVTASDVRLLRRIVRDRHQRGIRADSTIMRWPLVRLGEQRHIFPYQDRADAVFDSSLIYELSVLKVYAERYLLEVPQRDAAYPTAFRLLRLLAGFVTIYPDHVPPTSILREFIGGSGFRQ